MDIFSEIIEPALRETNPNAFAEDQIKRVALFGREALFDSIGFVSFVVVVEEKIMDLTGKTVTLVDEKAFSSRNSPFRNLETLCNFIQEKLDAE